MKILFQSPIKTNKNYLIIFWLKLQHQVVTITTSKMLKRLFIRIILEAN